MSTPEERAELVESLKLAIQYKQQLDELDNKLLLKIPEIEQALGAMGLREAVSVKLERITPERVIEFQTYRNRPVRKKTIPAFHVPVGFLWWRKFAGHPTEAMQKGPWRLVVENLSGNSVAMTSAGRDIRLLCFQALPALMRAFAPQLQGDVAQRQALLAGLTEIEK